MKDRTINSPRWALVGNCQPNLAPQVLRTSAISALQSATRAGSQAESAFHFIQGTRVNSKNEMEIKMKEIVSQLRATSLTGRRRTIAGLVIIGLIASLAIGVSSALGQSYTLTDLGVVPGMKASEAAAINSQGEVAGTSSIDREACAFRYDLSGMKDVGGLGSRAFAISPSGLVAGDVLIAKSKGNVRHAAIFKLGLVAELGTLPGGIYSCATGINAVEQVVGFSGPTLDGEKSRAFVWSAWTGMMDLGSLGGPFAQAFAINDAGFITGTADVSDPQGIGWIGETHAFLAQFPGRGYAFTRPMLDLGTLGGGSSYGLAINAFKQVVGYSAISPRDDRFHAFFFDGQKMIDLGSLAGGVGKVDYSVALGLNNYGQVVGYAYLPTMDAAQVAFLYEIQPDGKPSSMVDLNTLIGPAVKRYWLISASGINDKGQISATAFDRSNGSQRAVLLTPSSGRRTTGK